jgi:hypothetical protein
MSESAEEANARNRARRGATCRHFNGLQHDTCKAGIPYESVKAGPGCWPCLPPFNDGQECSAVCASKTLPTPEELDERDREVGESLVRLMKARGAIVDATGGQRRTSGEITCPNCGGKLRYTVASNGHIWGACSTEGCARWME